MISTFQRNRHFRKVLVNKTFTHVQEQKKAMSPQHSAYIPSSVKSPLRFYTILNRICLEKFEQTITLHLSKDKKKFFKNLQENVLYTLVHSPHRKKVSYLYMKRALLLFEFLSRATMFRGDL